MLYEGLAGVFLLAGGLALMLLVVPLERIVKLLPVGLVGGLGAAFLLIYLLQNVFGYWTYNRADVLHVLGVPFLVAASWAPFVIIFSHLLSQYDDIFLMGLNLAFFPLGGTVVHVIMLANQMLTYNNWNLAYTFLMGLLVHIGILMYLYVTGRIDNLRLKAVE